MQPQILVSLLGTGAIALVACSPMTLPAADTRSELINTSATAQTRDNVWASRFVLATSPPGWTIAPCEGTAPFLCFYQQGQLAGTLELQQWTLEQMPEFEQALAAAGLNQTQIDLEDLTQLGQMRVALTAQVADFYQTLEQDRAAEAIAFTAESPVEVAVGSLPGLRYGFQQTDPAGTVQEQTIGYIAFDGQTLYVITTTAPYDSPPGFGQLVDLQALQPYLDSVVRGLQL
ncbi:MAG: hypothetical protein ACTS3T_17625 [Almyronema sp.]